MNTLAQVIAYYESFCPYQGKELVNAPGSMKALGNFFYGEEDVLIDAVASKAVYPLLFLEAPGLKVTQNLQSFEIVLHIVRNAKSKAFQEQKQVQDECFNIARKLWARIRKQHKERLIQIDLDSCSIEPVYYLSIANLTGVRLSFTQYPSLDLCDNPLDYN